MKTNEFCDLVARWTALLAVDLIYGYQVGAAVYGGLMMLLPSQRRKDDRHEPA